MFHPVTRMAVMINQENRMSFPHCFERESRMWVESEEENSSPFLLERKGAKEIGFLRTAVGLPGSSKMVALF
ncbi:hypothetical protein JW824_09210 [bacterium]|nr:hypothetical protein [bacterium]